MSRRRVLGVLAGTAAGLAALRLARSAARPAPEPVVWRGPALGALGEIRLYDPDRDAAARLLDDAVSEIGRLEAVFSLYRDDSALVALNARGRLAAPPADLVRLLGRARALGDLTGGAFDVTVQPLWTLHAAHFARHGPHGPGPAEDEIARARALVDYRAIDVGPGRVALGRAGMAITLNGIAQGYITDAVAARLRAGGAASVLVDLGEIRAVGSGPHRRPWRIGVRDPVDPRGLLEVLEVADRAVATSAGRGSRFDAAGRFHHLFDPRTGHSAARYASVTVQCADATTADALSTAFSSMPCDAIASVLRRMPRACALLAFPGGSTRWIEA